MMVTGVFRLYVIHSLHSVIYEHSKTSWIAGGHTQCTRPKYCYEAPQLAFCQPAIHKHKQERGALQLKWHQFTYCTGQRRQLQFIAKVFQDVSCTVEKKWWAHCQKSGKVGLIGSFSLQYSPFLIDLSTYCGPCYIQSSHNSNSAIGWKENYYRFDLSSTLQTLHFLDRFHEQFWSIKGRLKHPGMKIVQNEIFGLVPVE